MKPIEQLIAIAEECGWTSIEVRYFDGPPPEITGINSNPYVGDYSCRRYVLPQYLSSYTAIDGAVRQCRDKLNLHHPAYSAHLRKVVRAAYPNGDDIDYYHASAAMRAEAFLKTLNLWTT